ncbi:hypothetical protein ACH5RR_013921 [Cinchona calisaya]|uniref:BHLH domain-containing protein n=1 Tax=Cinchona calisaya TaxID=153742 RepID=A0ABD3A1J0_9GENT
MDLSTAKWLSELEMDDPALNYKWPEMMNSIDQSVNDDVFFDQFASIYQSTCTEEEKQPYAASQTATTSILIKPSIQLNKKQNTSQRLTSSPLPRIISFGNFNDIEKPKYTSVKTESYDMTMPLGSINSFGEQYGTEYGIEPFHKKGLFRTPLQAQDHVLSERKRREKLSQHFISLSAIVPDLKKWDKASIIGGAIKRIKQLEERIKLFEERKSKRKPRPEESSIVSGKRGRPRTYNYEDASSCGEIENVIFDDSSCDDQQYSSSSAAAENIELRISGGDVLIRVQCKKQKEIMLGFFSEMEKINYLTITNSNFMPFGEGMLLISAVAQMDEEFSMAADDIANDIRKALLKPFNFHWQFGN